MLFRQLLGVRTNPIRTRPAQPGIFYFLFLFLERVRPASAQGCILAPMGASIGDWLVRHITVFGVPVQNWMLIALAIIAVSIIISWWLRR